MNRTLCLKILYGIILVSLGTIVYWSISNTSKNYHIIIGLLLLIPGRISKYFYQDFYTGRMYMDKNDFDKALYYFLKFELCIEEKPWKKAILWLTWPIYTVDALAMVKHNISSIYISKGEYEEAEKYIKDALSIDNKYPLPYLNLSVINMANDKKEEAMNNIKKSIKLGMNNSKVDKIIRNMQSVYANIQSGK
ncbi:tetratricopeptide repeat protein [Treponema putidum]|uniref:tetratricopeptide repeat protein n=1 Tax=Treponema putidum TaxID=221027 RepID=UPI0004F7E886|nr:tetratricopeptide repeat protein [Treponema putidum]AIN93704.1 hypothetical protein JO40_05925 [Treponema putidum]TWI77804.1 tetratricopeptide repeat protein [Treponema putidum]